MSLLSLLKLGSAMPKVKAMGRYNLARQATLPTFGPSEKTQPVVASIVAKTSDPKPLLVEMPVAVKPEPVRSEAARPIAAKIQTGAVPAVPAAPVVQPAVKKVTSGLSWLGKSNPFAGAPAASAAPVAKAEKPMQPELSLDKVKVVRNDLSDADLEVVPTTVKKPKAPPGSTIPDKRYVRPGAQPDQLGKKAWGMLERGCSGRRQNRIEDLCAVTDFAHKPVLMVEVLAALKPAPGGRYADGTLGGAGHARAMLAASSPTGWLYGCDRDGAAIDAAQARLAEFAGRFELRRGNFSGLADWVPPGSCDGVLLDLGVSSPQLDSAERGFSFQSDGPLDMRMDARQKLTAADLVNTKDAEALAKIFWEYGDERDSRRFARAMVHDRGTAPFKTTRQLAGLIERLSPRRGKTHPATKVFQALRIAVNDEIGSLNRGLEAALKILRPGGRLAVITFHSLEDRVVKDFGRARSRDYTFPGGVDVPELRAPRAPDLHRVTTKALKPGDDEVAENPRARSAQLRVFEKV